MGMAVWNLEHIFLYEKRTAFVDLDKAIRRQRLLEQKPWRVYQAQVADNLEIELYHLGAFYSDMAPADADDYYYGCPGEPEDHLQEDDFYNADDDVHTEPTFDWLKPTRHN